MSESNEFFDIFDIEFDQLQANGVLVCLLMQPQSLFFLRLSTGFSSSFFCVRQ
jgi:hypothetical protein